MNSVRKVAAAIAAAAMVSGSGTLSACAPQPADVELLTADDVTRASVQTAHYSAQLEAFNASARKLGATLLADGGDSANGNVVSSPASLSIALSMLRAGASGATAAEMGSALGLPDEGHDEAMYALVASLEKFDGDPGSVDEENPPHKPAMHAANGLFLDKGVLTFDGYLATLAEHFGTGCTRCRSGMRPSPNRPSIAGSEGTPGAGSRKHQHNTIQRTLSACSTRSISQRPGKSPSMRATRAPPAFVG